jgi:hypothetical protein
VEVEAVAAEVEAVAAEEVVVVVAVASIDRCDRG